MWSVFCFYNRLTKFNRGGDRCAFFRTFAAVKKHIKKKTMEQRKIYETPATEVVELELQGSLLASSSVESTGTFEETGDLYSFEDEWE